MPNKKDHPQHDSIGAWTKRCYLAGRVAMEAALRPYDLGATQWYVLYQLAHNGPTMQRDLQQALQIERATLSVVITTLNRKRLVEQVPDQADQRQKLVRMTRAGKSLWEKLPDLTFIHEAAFGDMKATDIATTIRVLQTATARLERLTQGDHNR